MRFLTFAMSDFEDKPELQTLRDNNIPFIEFVTKVFGLGEDVIEAIGYALAYCTSPTGMSRVLAICILIERARLCFF